MKYTDVNGYEWSTKNGYSVEEIKRIKDDEMKYLIAEKTEKARQRYLNMYKHIQDAGFDQYIDPCADAECVSPLKESDGHDYWVEMYSAMITSVGFRLEEVGVSASDYGIPY